jgi:Peptidase family M28
VAKLRELRGFDHETGTINSTVVPAYLIDGQESSEVPTTPPTNATSPSFIVLSNDSRLFFHDEEYYFEDVESQDEDQRQRRRLRSARNEMNLLNADHEHITTMITTVFSTARNYLNNETVRANVVQYLTHKMRSFGLVTGNQIFHPIEFAALVRTTNEAFYTSTKLRHLYSFLRVTHFLKLNCIAQFSEGDEGDVPSGTNVIGILPGELWGTKEDEVLVIGAHWDTVPFSGGMDDNGSGVTAVLEVRSREGTY